MRISSRERRPISPERQRTTRTWKSDAASTSANLRGRAVALGRAGAGLRGLVLAVLRRRLGHELGEQPRRDRGDVLDGAVERVLVGLGGLRGAGDLADVLQRGGLDLLGGGRGLEVVKGANVATHALKRKDRGMSTYDYVIVGAGSAGCVLAARLSEDPDVRVLLLEAGPPDVKENVHVPLGYLQLAKTDVDWDYSTAPEPFCGGRRVYLPRGRVFGGSSSMNAMIYIRGNPRDYDGWGIPGWGWDDLLPYFKRAEDSHRGPSEWHGTGGPLTVSASRSNNPMMDAWVEAGAEAGLPVNDDFNG